ncbi:30S ribosomal protein S12 methylthiotransferase RimO [Candidatus Desulforudis audaxviator]|uniref:Ribosomal protein uS12 methylthiotransferase RimO n=1 Tax=Desulforudis audaxviator (strain MP104C) TaxID=477974 RepID=RIMO_DESAP|nr:30S ribosomal protein S12 methylthiotransferase RimO [Candidatus Desulforudis audaxviator]B1I310.1 RecName: Full=Ribosomal protein uS12 methylthiotransferase RimO; Short=uS12 MTTase; Short=uS12 methylthiotransferase; AltName: Full=Ribosomal protein uS12 (aspartate-C(3))-methylthiotransferase; AltName: Full=Ribosome maturation factor RimO [Candidatus Desulforudis audaxviator MP104C]ACA59353.1 MiaB-like tRNA modifying enzyme YliG [Candidatus Desulforudis audaxviator MP104C]
MNSPWKAEASRIALVSLGCDKNRVDGEVMLGLLERAGYQITAELEADIILVNTCAFIQDAKQESIEAILETARYRGNGRCRVLLATGCLAQRYPDELLRDIPELDGVVGTGEVGRVVDIVRRAATGERVREVGPPGFLGREVLPRVPSGSPFTAYLKISEGCDNRCLYCVIPQLRGPYRSREASVLVREARALAARGAREIVLVAQDTTRYGSDLKERTSLTDLVSRLAALEGVAWIRLLYCYPSGITFELVELMAREPRLCRYLDIPLQHASDRVLRRMGRSTMSYDLRKLILFLRSAIPGLTIRSTFMVGFPGETEADFEELLGFLKAMKLDRAGFFAYSREEGTPAARMPDQVPPEVKRERLERAAAVQREVSRALNRARVGSEVTVLVEGRKGEQYYGRSEADAPDIDGRVFLSAASDLEPGTFVRARITGAGPYDLRARVLSTLP